MAVKRFSFVNFLLRFVMALALVFGTYNPSEYSWYHWLIQADNWLNPLLIFTAVVLLDLPAFDAAFAGRNWHSPGGGIFCCPDLGYDRFRAIIARQPNDVYLGYADHVGGDYGNRDVLVSYPPAHVRPTG